MHEIHLEFPSKNAIGSELLAWLEDQIESSAGAPLLLTGSNGAFSAGLDLREVHDADAVAMERFLARLDALCVRLYLHPAPVVAAVNGHAIAGGAVLACCCDWRVATSDPKTKIGVSEVALGACFPPAILRVMEHRLPAHARDRALLGAGLFAPQEALALGFVDEIADDPLAAARTRLEALAKLPREVYAHTKHALRERIVALSLEDARRFKKVEVPLWMAPEMKARLAAFLKR